MSFVKQVPFGQTGIKISPIIVGCMSYGSKEWLPWCLEDEEQVFEILKFCYDNGLRTFDTANCYSNGKSERLLGKFLKKYNIKRETVVILTKVFFPVDEDLGVFSHADSDLDTGVGVQLANQRGLSRKNIFASAKASMERLGTYIDVLQIHRLDLDTPFKEIMKSLNDVVEAGYTRYIGASTMKATEFVELQMIADKYEWFRFVNLQIQYNLLYREDERELIPFAHRHKIAMTPWSPNARGLLTRPITEHNTKRNEVDKRIFPVNDVNREIINRLEALAKKHQVSMATISTNWVLSKGYYPIVGMSSVERVQEAIDATKLHLTEEETKYLEEPYKPREVFV
ncbi:putative aryl-alcohol dehydrogenase Aad16p [Monosporozyma unispora]|nr:aryl-alcohol dehydrogenase [Kazachstania unispora]